MPRKTASSDATETSRPPVAGTAPRSLDRRQALPAPALLPGFAAGSRAALPAILALSVAGLLSYVEILQRATYAPSFPVMLAIFVAATLSSVAGFAFSAICGAVLFHLLGTPVHVVEIMMASSIGIQMLSVLTLRNAIEWRCLSRFLLGGMVALPLGIYLLMHTAPALYMKGMGIFLILYGTYMLFRRPVATRCPYASADYAAGFLGGLTGGAAGFPGAFVTIWCGLKGWTKERQRGVYQPFILIMQVAALTLILLVRSSGPRAAGMDLLTLSYVPAALLGTWCGITIFRRMTDRQFARVVNLLLMVSGFGLIS